MSILLTEIDSLEINVIVDNVTDSLSTVPENVIHEMDYLKENGMQELSGECLCCGAHGLSLLITAIKGDKKHVVLFDAGPEGNVIKNNLTRLNIDPTVIEEIVLSHGHWDHAGGFLGLLESINNKNPQHNTVFHVNPGMFCQRAVKHGEHIHPFKIIPSEEELEKLGAAVINELDARLFLDDTFYLSGEIPRITSYEKGFPSHVKLDSDKNWVPDPLILDERFLAVHVRNKGLIVFSACSHAGIINVLEHAKRLFPKIPIYAVMGGFHLSGQYVESIIPQTVNDMKKFNLQMIIPAHCTGFRAVSYLYQTFGDNIVVPSAVGRIYRF